MLSSIRELVAGTKVCRVFRQACLVHLKRAWGGYERQMRGFDKCGNECQNLIEEALVAKLRRWRQVGVFYVSAADLETVDARREARAAAIVDWRW